MANSKRKTSLEIIQGELARLNVTAESFNDIASDNAMESEVFQDITKDVDTSLELASLGEDVNELGKLSATRASLASLNTEVAMESAKLDMSNANVQMHTATGKIPESLDNALEAFGSQDPSELASRSYKYNLKATRQDEFSKYLFPMIIGMPGASGVKLSLDVDYLYKPHATTAGAKFDRTLLMKTYADLSGPLNDDALALVPVSNVENAPYLSKALVGTEITVKDTDGSTYQTAPLKFGKTIPIVAIGQSPATTARGLPQDTTMLDSSVSISEIIFNVAGAGARYNSNYLNNATFTYSKQGTTEEIELNLVNNNFVLDYGKLVATDVANPDIAGLAGLAGTHVGVYQLVIHGAGNTESKTIAVFGSNFELVELRTKAGAIETDSGLIDKAKALLLDSYNVSAHITNEDVNELGLVLTDTTVTEIIAVKPMSPRAIVAPLRGIASDDPKVDKLINITYYDLALETVNALTNIANYMRNNYSADYKVENTDGIGRYFVDPYFDERSMDLTNTVDSIRSGERSEDIAGAIILNIKQIVNNMVTQSGYGLVREALGGTIDVIVATNADIASFLPSTIDLGEGKRVKIVSRHDKTGGLANKIYIAFGNFDLKPGEFDPISFGSTAYIPTLVGTGERSVGKSTTRVLVVQPKAQAVTHTYILGLINITGLDGITNGKVTHNVSQ